MRTSGPPCPTMPETLRCVTVPCTSAPSTVTDPEPDEASTLKAGSPSRLASTGPTTVESAAARRDTQRTLRAIDDHGSRAGRDACDAAEIIDLDCAGLRPHVIARCSAGSAGGRS